MNLNNEIADDWACLAEDTHKRLCQAEEQGDWQKVYALRSVFAFCFNAGIDAYLER